MCFPESYTTWEETGRFIKESFLRQGHEIFIFDDLWRTELKSNDYMNKALLTTVKQVKPDVLFMLKSESIMPATLKKINCAKVLWHPDVRKNVQQWVVDKARECDFFYTMSKGSVEEYSEHLSNVKYLPEACDPNYHFHTTCVDNYFKSDVNFIGTVRDNRIDLVKRVIRGGFNFKIWGGLSAMSQKDNEIITPYFMKKRLWREFHSYAASDSISVTWDWCPEVELSYSARIYRVMASRGLYICKYVKGMEQVFKRGVHCDWYHTLDELEDKLKYYLIRKSKIKQIGKQAQAEVYANHTFDHRTKIILEDIKKKFGDFT